MGKLTDQNASQPLEVKSALDAIEQKATREINRVEMRFQAPMLTAEFRGYIPRKVELQRLTRRHAMALKSLELALQCEGAMCDDGRHVKSPADAIRWLLDRLSTAQDA
jgi:hypothetical protein